MGTLLHIEFGGTSPQDEHDRLTREIWRLQQQLARLTEAVLSGEHPEGGLMIAIPLAALDAS